MSRTGKWIAAATSNGRIALCDAAANSARGRVEFRHGRLNDLEFSPDESALAVAARDLAVFRLADLAAPPVILRADGRNYGAARFSPDGRTLLTVTSATTIEEIDCRSGALRTTICCSSIAGDVAFTPGGQAIVAAGHWPRVWDARSGQLLAALTRTREFYTFVPAALDPARNHVLMGSQDGRVYVWNLETRRLVAVSPPSRDYVDTLAVSIDGWAVYAAPGKPLQMWNPDTGERRAFPGVRPASNIALDASHAVVIFGTAGGWLETRHLGTGDLAGAVQLF